MKYYHRQIGYLIIFFGVLFFIVAIFAMIISSNLIYLVALFGFLMLLILFFSLTVIISKNLLIIKFGCGIFNKKIKLQDVKSVKIVKNKWFYGWGIRKIRHGWLYNVSGFMSVEIKLQNNRIYRIGTDEPEKLEEAILLGIKK